MKRIKQPHWWVLNQLEKWETANPNWRPKKLVSHFNEQLKKEGYEPLTQSQLLDAFNLIFNLDIEKLKELQKKIKAGENMPFIYSLLLKQLHSNKWLEALEKMLDRAYWKATQKVEQKQETTVNIINSEDQKILDEVLNDNIWTEPKK